ncbi:50S ribosomal protein L3, chloroplastic [Vitis vinifera]|uniref:50S ribosomal protein L3, chloroplastic n=1 Tax=Vitis vinifera TaxID=29760 RepID=A0A438CCF2_VITVI|nr:50S ribosomal protein L3, chloroplastic [Vitis vinifera]
MAHLTDLKWGRPIRPIQTVDKKGRDADYSLNSLLLLPSAGSPFIFLFHGGHRLTLLYSTASITNKPTLPLSLLVLIFLFHSKPFANPSPIAPPTIPLCPIHPPHHSDEHGGWRGVMATKLGMMSYFEPEGKVVPVTVVGFREGNIVTQVKTEATDGYSAVQVGYRRVRDRKLTKPEMGHLEKAGYDSDEAFAGVSAGVGGWV